jgi:transmembrane sensor
MDDFYDKHRIQELSKKWLNGTISDQEKKEFSDWYNAFPDDEIMIDADFAVNKDELEKRLYSAIDHQSGAAKVFVLRRIAAAVLILIIAGTIYYLLPGNTHNHSIATATDIIAPQQTKAVLILADGRQITLDNAANGKIAEEATGTIIKKDGGLIYSANNNISSGALNTISLPRGSLPVNVTLSDGTLVWLNAASSITYPVVFNDSTREVNITGEAYFDIAKNKEKPFHVKSAGQEIEVLGTEFNVNAYTDEPGIKTTLLEGKIKIVSAQQNTVLNPGQEVFNDHKKLVTYQPADVYSAAAWKDNRFVFGEQADIETIMRTLSRWYNIDIRYQGKPALHFGGSIPRNITLSQALKVLENTGGVHFIIHKNIVTVTP